MSINVLLSDFCSFQENLQLVNNFNGNLVYAFFSNMQVFLLRGKRRECLEEPTSAENRFGPEHYEEIAFVRNVCVELGRHLIRKLQLPDATQPCQVLAITRTSTTWPCLDREKWKWNDEKHTKAFERVVQRALRMVKDFNDHVSKYPVITDTADQKFVWISVGIAASRLIKSRAVDKNPELIGEIYKLRSNYCQHYKPVTLRESFQKEESCSATDEVIYNNLPRDVYIHAIEEETNNAADGYGNKSEEEIRKPTEADKKENFSDHPVNQENWEENKALEKAKVSETIQQAPPQRIADNPTQITKAKNTARSKNEKDEEEELLQMEAQRKEEEAEKEIAKAFAYEEKTYDFDEVFPMHESVFQGNAGRVAFLLDIGYRATTKDKHGNTPLHVAVMLGRKACIYVLLHYGASVRTKNLAGWSPMDEAISYGDRDTILLLWREFNQQFRHDMIEKRRKLLLGLSKTPDFYIKLKWELCSYVPGLSRVLPSDTYELYKHGAVVKLDTSLSEFSPLKMKWERSKITYIFSESTGQPSIYRVDYAPKYYGLILQSAKTEKILHEEVTEMMSDDILSYAMLTDKVTFTRSKQSGPLGLGQKKDKIEILGQYKSEFYHMSGLVLVQRKRSEHLSQEQIKHNNEMNVVENLANGLDIMTLFKTGKKILPVRLPPVPDNKITWETYIKSKPGEAPILGRPLKPKETVLPVAPEIAVTSDFPISKELVIGLLEVIAPFKHFAYLRDFMKIMPDGFPVQLEIPIKATVSAKYTFLECQITEVPDNVFEIPSGFRRVRWPGTGLIFF